MAASEGPDTSKAEEKDKIKEVQFRPEPLKRQPPQQDRRRHIRSLSESSYFSSLSSTSGSSESSSHSSYSLRSPEGGWGWVVVLASFFINMIADGITFSFGLIFIELEEEFQHSKAVTAGVVGLFHSVPLLSGPIASAMTDRYGCKRVTIFGSILATVGFLLTSIAQSLTLIYFTCGVLAGFGLSLCYVAAVVTVVYYFDRRRSLATGISVCGSGVGTLFFGPFINLLIKHYEWRGTMVILAGFLLNMCVCAMVFRELEWVKTIRREKRAAKASPTRASAGNVSQTTSEKMPETEHIKAMLVDGDVTELFHEREDPVEVDDIRISSSLVQIPTYLTADTPNFSRISVDKEKRPHTDPEEGTKIRRRVSSLFRKRASECRSKPILKSKEADPPAQEPLLQYRTAKMDQQHLNHLKMRRKSLTYRGAMLNIGRYRLRASNSCPDIYRNSMIATAVGGEPGAPDRDVFRCLRSAFSCCEWGKFMNAPFCLFLLSNFILYGWYDVMYTYLPDYAEKTLKWTPASSASVLPIIGIFNTIGEVFVGYFGDKAWMSRNCLYAGCMLACGASTAAVPFVTSRVAVSAMAAVFGFAISANYSLTSPILVDLVSIEEFSNAYGLLLLVQGLSNLFGPTFGGWLYDVTREWYLTFALGGGFVALSGLLVVILPLCKLLSSSKRSEEIKEDVGVVDVIVEVAPGRRKEKDAPKAQTLNL